MSAPATRTAEAETIPDWIAVYFTDPDGAATRTLRGGPDRALADAIDAARVSVDMAIYELDLWSVREALLRAHRRGLTVRIVAESDFLGSPGFEALKQAGIPILGDRRQGLMHNKFAIIDRSQVWTGSMNFTLNGSYHNDNNLLCIRSSQLAESYLAEFDEMFVDDLFGPASPLREPASSPVLLFSKDGTALEVYFSPEDDTAARLIELIDGAKAEIQFMVYAFTSDEIARALIERAQAGVAVAGIMDESQARTNLGTEFERLKAAGIDVRLDGNPDKMHHKVLLIDRATVITGSYNFSVSAQSTNDENTLVIHSPPLAEYYQVEFQRIFEQASP